MLGCCTAQRAVQWSLLTNISCCDAVQVQLLVDYLTGNFGAPVEQQLSSRICQLIIAGGTLGQLEPLAAAQPYSRQQNTSMEPVR